MMKKVTKAVIPAAGLGTRVLPATKAMPKGMLPIVDKPAIQYLVEEAVRSGITDILIILGRNQSIIEDHFDRSPELEEKLAKPGKEKALEECLGIANVLMTPEIYEILAHTKPGAGGEIQLTDAMAEYARTRGGMTAVEFTGKHYDMGNKLKVVEAQVELALQHPEIGEEFRTYLKEFCKTL